MRSVDVSLIVYAIGMRAKASAVFACRYRLHSCDPVQAYLRGVSRPGTDAVFSACSI